MYRWKIIYAIPGLYAKLSSKEGGWHSTEAEAWEDFWEGFRSDEWGLPENPIIIKTEVERDDLPEM